VKQAIAAGVKKIVVTGTFATLFDCKCIWLPSTRHQPTRSTPSADFQSAFGTRVLTEKDFGSVTLESIDLNKDGMQVYQEAKTLADKKIWELAHEHPQVDFTVGKY